MQTAVGVFGNEGEIYGSDVDSVIAPKNEISTLNSYPPIFASELCRDRLVCFICYITFNMYWLIYQIKMDIKDISVM